MHYLGLFLTLSLLSSCGTYNSSFQCSPGKGLGCASVGEVLDLIVEKEKGADLLAKNKESALLLKQREQGSPSPQKTENEPHSKPLILIQTEEGAFILAEEKE